MRAFKFKVVRACAGKGCSLLPGMWPVGSKALVPLVKDTDKGRMDCGGNQPQELGE